MMLAQIFVHICTKDNSGDIGDIARNRWQIKASLLVIIIVIDN